MSVDTVAACSSVEVTGADVSVEVLAEAPVAAALGVASLASVGATAGVWAAFSAATDCAVLRRLGALTVGMEGRARRAACLPVPRPRRAAGAVWALFSCSVLSDASLDDDAEASGVPSEEKKTSTGRPLRRPEEDVFAAPADLAVDREEVETDVLAEVVPVPFFGCVDLLLAPEVSFVGDDDESPEFEEVPEDALVLAPLAVDDVLAAAVLEDVLAGVFPDALPAVFPAAEPEDFCDAVEGVLSAASSDAAAAAEVVRRRGVVLFEGAVAASWALPLSAGALAEGDCVVSSVSAVLWIRAPRPRPRPPRRVFFTRPPEVKRVSDSLEPRGRPSHAARRSGRPSVPSVDPCTRWASGESSADLVPGPRFLTQELIDCDVPRETRWTVRRHSNHGDHVAGHRFT